MKRFTLALLLTLAALAAGIGIGRTADHDLPAVCHSSAEDSVIRDCDYRDGAWYPETNQP